MIGRRVWIAAVMLAAIVAPSGSGTIAQTGAVQATPRGTSRLLLGGNGTVMLRGSLKTTLDITMRGAFSVGRARNLSWDLLHLTGMSVSGYNEQVVSERYAFNVQPDSFQDLSVNGLGVRRFFWSQPPANSVIKVTVHRTLRVASNLSRFHGTAGYPLASLPSEVQPYLQVTPSLRLSSSQRSFVRRLVGHQAKEQHVVQTVANWVGSHVHYDAGLVGGPFSASWVMSNQRATCQGYASLMAGMLRTLGIPSQVVYGWVSSKPITVRAGRSTEWIEWAPRGTPGAFHDWLNVYFPGTGWVSFDPQREKFFVDSRHYALLTEVDASDPYLGHWTAEVMAGDTATGASLSSGTFEAVPEDGSYTPTGSEHDALQLQVASVVHDVKSVTLFAR